MYAVNNNQNQAFGGALRQRPAAQFFPRQQLAGQANLAYSSRLNNVQRQLLAAPAAGAEMSAAQGAALTSQFNNQRAYAGDMIDAGEGQMGNTTQQAAEFIQELGANVVGRGVNKAAMTTAQQTGVNVKNPYLFGVQAKQPVPYARLISDRQKLNAMLAGYSDNVNEDDPQEGAKARLLAQVMMSQDMLGKAFEGYNEGGSIYDDIPRNTAVNLYNINIRNSRRDRLLSIQ